MKTKKDIFREMSEELEARAQEIIKTTFCNMTADYLPWVKTDTETNVEFRLAEELKKFFNGQPIPYINHMILDKYSGVAARDLIYQEHKDEIIQLIGRDKDNRIKYLEDEICALMKK